MSAAGRQRLPVFIRVPVPGRIKTRLIDALGEQGAAAFEVALLRRPNRSPKTMTKKPLIAALVALSLLAGPLPAEDKSALASAMEEFLEFAEYGSSIILPEQIPAEDWPNILVVDARDAGQFSADHIPDAVNIEWRQAVARRDEIPRDRPMVMYCNTGSLSAQAVFALRLLGWDNVRVLQDGLQGWKAKGGFEAHQRAVTPAGESGS
jgi:rhodanese-related sulfurtransferase